MFPIKEEVVYVNTNPEGTMLPPEWQNSLFRWSDAKLHLYVNRHFADAFPAVETVINGEW